MGRHKQSMLSTLILSESVGQLQSLGAESEKALKPKTVSS